MSVIRIDVNDDALDRVMTLSQAKTTTEAVNFALRYYAERQDRAARISRRFARAQQWGAIEDAERRHRAEKDGR